MSPLLTRPRPAPPVDAAVIECTYGPIHRKATVRQQPAEFRRAVGQTIADGGVAWIPCFSLTGPKNPLRTASCPKGKIAARAAGDLLSFAGGPGSNGGLSQASDGRLVFANVAARLQAFFPHEVRRTLNPSSNLPRPCIIISTSNLLGTAPWMQRLLADLLPDPKPGVFLVGYQLPNTVGLQLLRGAKELEIDGRSVAMQAKIHSVPRAFPDTPTPVRWTLGLRRYRKRRRWYSFTATQKN